MSLTLSAEVFWGGVSGGVMRLQRYGILINIDSLGQKSG